MENNNPGVESKYVYSEQIERIKILIKSMEDLLKPVLTQMPSEKQADKGLGTVLNQRLQEVANSLEELKNRIQL